MYVKDFSRAIAAEWSATASTATRRTSRRATWTGGRGLREPGAGGSPALGSGSRGRPGVVVVPMASPYVYLGGRSGSRRCDADGRPVAVSISTDNGRTFTPVWSRPRRIGVEAVVDLTARIAPRYAYWLKLELIGDAARRRARRARVENDFQHAPAHAALAGQGQEHDHRRRRPRPDARHPHDHLPDRAGRRFTKNETAESMGVVFDNLNSRTTPAGGRAAQA